MSAPREGALSLYSGAVATLAWGAPGGRPILALHGWLDNAASFTGVAPALAAAGAHVVALDLPGHGRSDHRPPGVAYHFVDWVPVVFEAAAALGWERFGLVGHSMGAGVALLSAGAVPERVESLVCLEGLGPLVTEPADAPARLGMVVERRLRRRDAANKVHPSTAALLERMLEARRALAPHAAEAIAARGVEEVTGGVRFAYDPRLQEPSALRFTEAHVHAFFRRIACPVQLVRARGGWPMDDDFFRARLACLADVAIVEVDGGHHVHLDEPERVAPAVVDFLARHPPDP